MPGYNGTGPTGAGPMTGRGRGSCNTDPDYGRPLPDVPFGFGRGMGLGRCSGRGLPGRRFNRRPEGGFPFSDELSQLKADAASTRSMLETISKRISQLEKNKA